MEREKPAFDILGKIEQERLARGWSESTLAENSGLTQSTISTWRRRNLQPNVASIEKVCGGLGITLAQFFSNSENDCLTAEQKEILSPVQLVLCWQRQEVRLGWEIYGDFHIWRQKMEVDCFW